MKKLILTIAAITFALIGYSQPDTLHRRLHGDRHPHFNGEHGNNPNPNHNQGQNPNGPNGHHSPEKNPFFLDQIFKSFMVKGYVQGGYEFFEKDETNPTVTMNPVITPVGPAIGPDGNQILIPNITYPHANSFNLKRAYIFCRAQITNRWSFWFMHDFCGIVNEYYVDFAAALGGQLSFRAGAFKHPYGLENPYSPTKTELIDIYSQGTSYLTGCGNDPLYGIQYGRDLGAMMYGDIFSKHLHYEFAILNGQGVRSYKDRNNKKDFAGRIEILPTQKFKIVASGQTGYGNADPTSTRPFQYTPNINKGDDYKRNRWAFGAEYRSTGHDMNRGADYWNKRPLVVRAEYMGGEDGDNPSDGAYITVAVPLPGKFDIVASYDYFNYNKDLAQMEKTKYVIGIQYWFYKQCRLQAQYTYVDTNNDFLGGYNVVQLQTQFAF